jgi:hypothetical protein
MWRRLVAQGSLTAAGSGEEVVPASDYRALQSQIRELHRLLGKKTLEAEILKEAPRSQVVSTRDPDESASTYHVSGSLPGQDGDPRVPVLIAASASMRHFFDQDCRTPVDCQAISLSTTRKHRRPISA